jgi:heat shock protein HslJ
LIAAPPLLALALQAAAPGPTEAYRAAGTEQTWSLTISDGRITLERPDHATLSMAAPNPQIDEVGRRYRTREFEISIMGGPPYCYAPDGARYRDTVYVNIGGRELSGCGGEALPADTLDGTSWHFAEIAGEATGLTGDLLRDDIYAIDFSSDRFVGYVGCNRIGGQYTRSNETLTVIPPIMSTRRACAEPIMRREQRLLEILSAPVRVSFPDRDTMLLTGQVTTVRLRRTRSDN